MPWSWLIDYFSNAGDWLETTRNIVGANRDGKTCIMTRSFAAESWRRQKGDDVYSEITGGSFDIVYERKEREVFSSFNIPEVTIPILSARQSAILGALASMRARRA